MDPVNRIRSPAMGHVETALALLIVGGLTYFAFIAVGDDFPLNVAIAVLAFVVAVGLVLHATGRGPR
jgi:hypothetical protein